MMIWIWLLGRNQYSVSRKRNASLLPRSIKSGALTPGEAYFTVIHSRGRRIYPIPLAQILMFHSILLRWQNTLTPSWYRVISLILEKMYTDFSDPPLIAKCQKCHTQNTKSLHSKLWSRVAKHKFYGLYLLFLARVISLDHNFGSEEGSMLRILIMDTSAECLRVFQEQGQGQFRC